jgi:hypothetical protein
MQPRRRRRPLVAALLTTAALAVAPGCGGRQRAAEGGEALLVGGRSLMGPAEERARNHVFDLVTLLQTNADAPDQAVDRVRALLSVNGARMLDDALAVADRFESLDAADARRYEAQLGAYLGEAWMAWRDALAAFTQQNPEAGRQIAELVEQLDRTPEARDRAAARAD